MARDHRRDSTGGAEDALEDSGDLWHRHDTRRELRAGCDALSAGDRHGGDVESRIDEARRRTRGDGNARRRHPLELFPCARCRTLAAVAAHVRDLRRRPLPGKSLRRGEHSRLRRHQHRR